MFISLVLGLSLAMIATLPSTRICHSQEFSSTIPVLDRNDFYNPDSKEIFVDKMAKAMHKIGFFAVIHPRINIQTLEKAYEASKNFFSRPIREKHKIFDLSLNGQRGYVPGETAEGFEQKDLKAFLDIGKSSNLWPDWMDLQNPMGNLLTTLDEHSYAMEKGMALAVSVRIVVA